MKRKLVNDLKEFIEVSIGTPDLIGKIHFLYIINSYEKLSLKNSEILGKCSENAQPQMPELQFLKTKIFPRAL